MQLGYFHPSVERHVIISANFLNQMQHVVNAEYHERHHGATMPLKKKNMRKLRKTHCAIELGYLDEPHHEGMIGSNEETPLLEIAG